MGLKYVLIGPSAWPVYAALLLAAGGFTVRSVERHRLFSGAGPSVQWERLGGVLGGHVSFMTAQPVMGASAAGSLQSVGSAARAVHVGARAETIGLATAAVDEVTAAQLAAHAARYQELSAHVSAVHLRFVNTLGADGSRSASEAADAATVH